MQITKPVFYNEFSCIADACPDTCCAGWQIMIDDKSLKKYRQIQGDFSQTAFIMILTGRSRFFRQYAQTMCLSQ